MIIILLQTPHFSVFLLAVFSSFRLQHLVYSIEFCACDLWLGFLLLQFFFRSKVGKYSGINYPLVIIHFALIANKLKKTAWDRQLKIHLSAFSALLEAD